MKVSQLAIAVSVGFALIVGATMAVADSGWYAGAGAGKARVTEDMCSGSADFFDVGTSSCSDEDTSTSWKVFGGYQFHPNAAAEFGYVDLGKSEVSARGTVLGVDSSLGGDWEPKGFTLGIVGNFPVGNGFELLGKVGFLRWDVDLSARGTGEYAGSGSEDDNGVDLSFGVGAKFNINKSVALRAELDRFKDVGDDSTTGQSDINMLSVGVQFGF